MLEPIRSWLVNGSNFQDGAKISLVQGALSLAASSVTFDSSGNKLSAQVSIPNNIPAGKYDVEVTNPDGQKTALSEGFEVTAPDNTPPKVLSTTPSDGATNVTLSTKAITVTFSEAVDPSTVSNSNFTLQAAGKKNKPPVATPGTVTVSSGGKTATFTPSAKLAKKTKYTAKISGAKDLAGNPLADKSWSFTTGKK